MKLYAFEKEHNDSMNYYWFENGFDRQELDTIYRMVETLPFEHAEILGTNDDIRNSRVKWIPQEPEWDWLYLKLMDMAKTANNELWQFEMHTAPEMIQYTEYLANENGKYDWHQDIGPGLPSLRKVSITVQLSEADEYEGGDLKIWMGGDLSDEMNLVTAPRGAGHVVVFPSYMPHCVTPVTKGIRRSFVIWLGGEHYK